MVKLQTKFKNSFQNRFWEATQIFALVSAHLRSFFFALATFSSIKKIIKSSCFQLFFFFFFAFKRSIFCVSYLISPLFSSLFLFFWAKINNFMKASLFTLTSFLPFMRAHNTLHQDPQLHYTLFWCRKSPTFSFTQNEVQV